MSLPQTQSQSIAATATVVTLKKQCKMLQIWSYGTTPADVFVRFDGVDPTVDDVNAICVAGGTKWESPADVDLECTTFKYIGRTAAGKLSTFGL